MKHIFRLFIYTLLFLSKSHSLFAQDKLADGQQPQIAVDQKGLIRIVYGRNDSVFCIVSANKGRTFTKPALVGVVPKMHLGMGRGPQLASSNRYSVVTAMDQLGNIHFFVLDHQKKTWQNRGLVNDLKASAPEGLMNISCDNQDNFYATWLDIRLNRKNNIYFSSLPAGKDKWHTNTLVYQSPDEHVCECCRPSIAVNGANVAIMFRNWLKGSRDLYLATSTNRGQNFHQAIKLGTGTWKLNACTMDGGGLNFDSKNGIHTAWQRLGTIYYAEPGENEKELGKGRDCSISVSANKVLVTMSDGGNVKYKNVQTNEETIVGKGSYLKTVILADDHVVCVWEDDRKIKSKLF